MRLQARFDPADLASVQKTLKTLPHTLQKRVVVQAIHHTTTGVVLPAVQRNIDVRSHEPPVWNARRGEGPAMKSHFKGPGILKKMMGYKRRVKRIKRTRTAVGRTVTTPTREDLGIPLGYKQYYPVAYEYGLGYGKKPRPFMRGVFKRQQTAVRRRFIKEFNKRVKKLEEKK